MQKLEGAEFDGVGGVGLGQEADLAGGEAAGGGRLGEAETERLQQICDDLSVCFAASIPTPFVPSGHFPLIGGIGPWKGSLSPARR